MVKKIGIIVTALLCILILAGCGCEHVWLEATCLEPATCELCGKTEGELGDHIWQEATCTAPKTCATCGATEGEALDHQWKKATCQTPKTCEVCGTTSGGTLKHDWVWHECVDYCKKCKMENPEDTRSHNWEEATCQSAKKCKRCGKAEGEKADHAWVDATCQKPKTCTVCGATEGDVGSHKWLEADCSNPKRCENCDKYEGTFLGHTLADGSDGVTGICTVCNKAVEYYKQGDSIRAWTDYEVAPDGSYINPVTYILDSWSKQTYEATNWLAEGKLNNYEVKGNGCTAFYADGKVYYYSSYEAKNTKSVARALGNAAKKYVSFVEVTYNTKIGTSVVLNGSGGWLADSYGTADAAYDVYGNTFAIVHKFETDETWAVACDWQK